MFREMLRKKQQIPHEQCLEILKTQLRGILAVNGDDGYPYAMPLNHYYCSEDGKIYFHGSLKGHKIEALRKNHKVCYCVYDEGYRKDGEWPLYINSVIVFGKVDFFEDREKVARISRLLSLKFTDDEEYISREIAGSLDHTLMFALVPEHISGKLVKES